MFRFDVVDREPVYLLHPSMDGWLPEYHLACFIVEVIDRVDLRGPVRQSAEHGGAAYYPTTLLSLPLFGHATGLHSRRNIERARHHYLPLRFAAANIQPDDDSEATFRRRFMAKSEKLSVHMVVLSREMKGVRPDNVARDETRIVANANKHRSPSWERAHKIETELREEVQLRFLLAKDCDSSRANDDLGVPAEIARHAKRLDAIVQPRDRFDTRQSSSPSRAARSGSVRRHKLLLRGYPQCCLRGADNRSHAFDERRIAPHAPPYSRASRQASCAQKRRSSAHNGIWIGNENKKGSAYRSHAAAGVRVRGRQNT